MLKLIIDSLKALFGFGEPLKIPAADGERSPSKKNTTTESDHDEAEVDGSDSPANARGEPAWLVHARAEDGTVEAPGKANNPRIVRYYAEAGHPEVKHDEVAWCAAFVGAMLHRAGHPTTGSLMARSYTRYGEACEPRVGAIVVLPRGNDPVYGHVGFLVGYDHSSVYVLGGNQYNPKTKRSEIVNVSRFPRSKVLAYRWPPSLKRSGVVHGLTTSGVGESLRQGAEPTADLFSSMGLELKAMAGIAPKLAAIGAVLVVLGLVYAFWSRRNGMKQNGI